MKIVCKKCSCWVDCTKDKNKPYGFCLMEDLFTYTEKTKCEKFIDGTPVTEKDFDDCHY